MTKAEAATTLGVDENATLADVRRKYESLHTDYQIRLTNAPTAALKKTYQQKLQELAAAGEALYPGFATNTTGGDLPSVEPVIVDMGGGAAPLPPRRPAAAGRDLLGQDKSDAAMAAGLPKSTIVAGVAAVIFAAALSFITVLWFEARSRLNALELEQSRLVELFIAPDRQNDRLRPPTVKDVIAGAEHAAAAGARAETVERRFFADRLRVRNLSKDTARIIAAAFVYRDEAGNFKVAHSGTYDYPTWDIRPGAIVQLDPEMARGRLWDGPVMYYSLLVEYPGAEPFLKAGIWADDIDRLDKVITLDLD